MVVERISCDVQKYAWGKIGSQSTVAKLAQNSCANFSLESDSPYAELWMGTHPKSPASLWKTGQKLSELISQNARSELGDKIVSTFGESVPFLLKVLSVNRALSIQAHPDKPAAEILHKKDPAHYPDDNHKPEMCIALTDFTGLCGFRPAAETAGFTSTVPELTSLIGVEAAQDLRDSAKSGDSATYAKSLKNAFANLMNADKQRVKAAVESLVARIHASQSPTEHILGDLVLRLNGDFPGDVGIFVIYFLNHMQLKPGEAMFLRANLPHAYLSGDCVEVMACSDNVVRAGLTPKFMDVETLVAMLDYSAAAPESFKFTADWSKDGVSRFNPPVPDFALEQIGAPSGGAVNLPVLDSASITLVTQSEGALTVPTHDIQLAAGAVFYASAGEQVTLQSDAAFAAYRAFVA